MSSRHYGALACLTIALCALLGCADVSVRKVTQQNAASLDGFRYYLPRPYLALKEAMPVAGDEFIVSAAITDGGDVTFDAAQLPEFLKYHFRDAGKSSVMVPGHELLDGAQADVALKKAAEGTAAVAAAATAAAAGSGGESGPQGTTVALESGSMSIVYLPDFSEQYAIKYTAGLGKVDTGSEGLRLRHGWMLDNVSLSIDNVELGKFIFSQIDKFTDLATLIGARKQKVLSEFSGTLKKASEGATVARPRHVRLRITYAVLAQPGLYPLLKPCERGCDCGRIAGSVGAAMQPATDSKNWVFIPYPPFTAIAFNVKRLVSVELLPIASAESRGGLSGGDVDNQAFVAWLKEKVPTIAGVDPAAISVKQIASPTGLTLNVQVSGLTSDQVAAADTEAVAALPATVSGKTIVRVKFAAGS